MKKTKLFILFTMGLMSLAGCGGGDEIVDIETSLPKGGTTVNVTGEQGQQTLATKLKKSVEAYGNLKLGTIGAKLSLSDVDVSADATASGSGISANAKVKAKDLGVNLEAKATRNSDSTVKASAVLSGTRGDLEVSGSYTGPDASGKSSTTKFSSDLEVEEMTIAAYLSGDKVYADISDKGIDSFISNIDSFANDLLYDIRNSSFYSIIMEELSELPIVVNSKFNIKGFYDSLLKETSKKFYVGVDSVKMDEKIMSADDVEEMSATMETVAQMISGLVAQNVGLVFKTYDNGGYGFELNMDKSKLMSVLSSFTLAQGANQINEMIKNFSLKAQLYCDGSYLIKSAGLEYSAAVSFSEQEDGMNLSVTTSESAKLGLELEYNGSAVSLPSFSGYKALDVDLGGNGGNGENGNGNGGDNSNITPSSSTISQSQWISRVNALPETEYSSAILNGQYVVTGQSTINLNNIIYTYNDGIWDYSDYYGYYGADYVGLNAKTFASALQSSAQQGITIIYGSDLSIYVEYSDSSDGVVQQSVVNYQFDQYGYVTSVQTYASIQYYGSTSMAQTLQLSIVYRA